MPDMTRKTIGIPVKSWVSEDGHSIYYSVVDKDDSFLATASSSRETKVRRLLKEKVIEILRAEDLRDRHIGRRILATKEGELFIVEYRNGWMYSITGKDRKHASSCIMGNNTTFEKTLEAAKKHANSAFGGVLYEAPL